MSYVVVARCVAQDEHKDEIEAVLREFVPQCRREPGHHDFVAQKSVERPNEFLLYEHFVTEQDFVDYGALQGTSVPTILLGSPAACARGRKSAPACRHPARSLYRPRRLALRRTAGPARARGQPVRSEKCTLQKRTRAPQHSVRSAAR